jgi:hypothetical protein
VIFISRKEARGGWWQWALAAGLLLAFAAQAALGSPHNSAAFDEEYHLAAGYVYLRTGDPRLSTEHPPLVNAWNALPLLLLDLDLPLDSPAWRNATTDDFGDAFLWQANPQQAVQIVLLGRLPIIALGLVLGAVVFRWTREMFGVKAGLLALALYAFDPNLIAHSRLSTTDLGLAAWMTIALWRLWAWLERPSAQNLVWTGAAAGAAMATKFTGLTLAPVFALVAALYPGPKRVSGLGFQGFKLNLRPPIFKVEPMRASLLTKDEGNGVVRLEPETLNLKRETSFGLLARRALALLLAALVALLVVWAVYGFELRGGLPAATYWHGLRKIWSEYSLGYPTFLLGRLSRTSWWYYFPLAFALKTPLPTLVFFAVGAAALLWRGRWRAALPVLIPPTFLMLAALFSPLAIGYRHILPILPFVIVTAGAGINGQLLIVNRQLLMGKLARLVLHFTFCVLIVWHVIGAVRIFPHHLSYFNELAGPSSNWHNLLVDSNLDWGQDLIALRQLMDSRGIEHVRLAYFGTAMPEAYGIRYTPLPGFLRFLFGSEVDAYNPYTPEPGWYAISATSLHLGLVYRYVDLYAYFRDKMPVARAGHSIHLYYVDYPQDTPVDRRVVSGRPVAEFSPEQLGLLPGHRLVVKWSRSPDTRIFPGDGEQAIGEDACLAAATGQLQPAVDFAGAFSLAGYQLESAHLVPGETISLTLCWQVASAQVETPRPGYLPPLAAFVHVVGSETPGIVAQYDGWGTALSGLERGDQIVHQVTLALPGDLSPGAYRLLVGLYSPQSMQRLPARLPGGTADHVVLAEIEVGGK